MRNTPRKVVLPLLGIAALSAFLVACISGYGAPETPFEQAAKRLRVGMMLQEAYAAMKLGEPDRGAGFSPRDRWVFYRDPKRDEDLELDFEYDRLTERSVKRR
jgi:hypothetical protein